MNSLPSRITIEILESRIVPAAPFVDAFGITPGGPIVVGQVATLEATASDPDAPSGDFVTAVRFYEDSNTDGVADSSELIDSDLDGTDGWSIDWATKNHAAGPVTLLAVAEDQAKTPSAPRPLNVTLVPPPVNQPPIVQTFTAASPSSIQIGSGVTLSATATDPDAGDHVSAVRFYDDQNGNGAADLAELINSDIDGTDGWQIDWDTTGHAPGAVTLLAVAEDASKTAGTPKPLNLTLTSPSVNNPPTVSGLTSNPASPITIGQTAILTAQASDPDAGDSVSAVRFYEDINSDGIATTNELINSDLNGGDGWSVSWDTFGHAAGSVALLAVAEDVNKTPGLARPLTVTLVPPNVPPVNQVPTTQTVTEETLLVFSSANGNSLSFSDADAGTDAVRITLSSPNGFITLSQTTGLTFSSGDGTGDSQMVATGTIAAINIALNGLQFLPAMNFSGATSLQLITDDLGHNGGGGAKTDTDGVTINVLPLNDAPTLTSVNTLARQLGSANYVITYDALAAAANETDPDGDALSFRVLTVSNGTLTKGGAPVVTGTTLLQTGETLVWTPADFFTSAREALTVEVTDGVLSSGNQVPVSIDTSAIFVGRGGAKSVIFSDADGTKAKIQVIGNAKGALGFSGANLQVQNLAGGAIQITGNNVRLDDLALDVASGTPTVNVSTAGGDAVISVSSISSDGGVKSLKMKGVNITESLQIHGSVNSATFRSLVNVVADIDGGIGTLRAAGWTGGSLHADKISLLEIKSPKGNINPSLGVFGADLTLDGAVGVKGATLGRVTVSGAISGDWSIQGSLTNVSVDSITDSWKAAITGNVGSIEVKGDLRGEIIATVIGKLRVGDSVINALISATSANSDSAIPGKAIGSVVIGGWLDGTVIDSASGIGSFMAGGVRDSRIFAGIVQGTTELPILTASLVNASTIGKLIVRGIKSDSGPFFLNTDVSASAIAKVQLDTVGFENGGDNFGFASLSIGSLRFKNGSVVTSWHAPVGSSTQSNVDFFARILT